MAQTVQKRGRDWRDPFSWFLWFLRDVKGAALFLYNTASGRLTGTETFTRASTATYVTEAGLVASAASGEKRDRHYINGQGPYLLLEGSRQNSVIQNRDATQTGTSWTLTNCTAAKDATGVDGVANSASTITVTASGGYARPTAGAITAAQSIHQVYCVKKGSNTWCFVGESADAVWHRVWVNLDTGALGTASGLTAQSITALASGWYRVDIQWTATNSFTSRPTVCPTSGDNATTSSIGNTQLLDMIQCEGAVAFGSSLIPTTTAAVTRSASADGFASTDLPMEQTVYVKLVSGQPSNFDGSIVCQRGSNAGARFVLSRTSGAATYTLLHNNGSASVSGTVAATTAVGDTHELRGILNRDGSVQLCISINGAAEVVGTASAANALTSAWGDGNFYLNGDSTGANQGFGSFSSVKRAPGLRTLSQMRSA